ncbi:MAG TPA: hypothetical protein VNO33_03590, partial [Kofleriaceae bacterium]|nr:hypothetical protein [Kofleriaceae bacterium]
MNSLAISARLREIAAYLVLEGDRFRARAYEKAARSLEGVQDLERLITERRLTELPRIGPSLAGAIEELSRSGTIDLLDRLREKWPKLVL